MPHTLHEQLETGEGGVSAPLCSPCLTNKLESMGLLKKWQKRGRINRMNRVKLENEDKIKAAVMDKIPDRIKVSERRVATPKSQTTATESDSEPKTGRSDIKMSLGSFL